MVVDVTKEFHESSGPEFSDMVVDFCQGTLEYYPHLIKMENREGEFEHCFLVFKNDVDALLFKLRVRGS